MTSGTHIFSLKGIISSDPAGKTSDMEKIRETICVLNTETIPGIPFTSEDYYLLSLLPVE